MTEDEKKALEEQKKKEQQAGWPQGGNDVIVGDGNDGGSAAVQQPAQNVQPETPAAAETSPYDEAKSYYRRLADIAAKKVADHPRQEKLERQQGLISGIADMGRALSNLYFTNQYAPNSYDDKEGMSEKVRARVEKAKAERDKQREAWLNYALKVGELDDAERAWNFKKEQAKAAQEAAAAKAEVEANRHAEKLAETIRHNQELEEIAKGKMSISQQNADTAKQNAETKKKTEEHKITTGAYNKSSGKQDKTRPAAPSGAQKTAHNSNQKKTNVNWK